MHRAYVIVEAGESTARRLMERRHRVTQMDWNEARFDIDQLEGDLLYVCGSQQALGAYFEKYPAAQEAAAGG